MTILFRWLLHHLVRVHVILRSALLITVFHFYNLITNSIFKLIYNDVWGFGTKRINHDVFSKKVFVSIAKFESGVLGSATID